MVCYWLSIGSVGCFADEVGHRLEMEIACAADTAYLPHTAAMLHSLLKQHAAHEITVHFLHDAEISTAELSRLAEFVRTHGGKWHTHCIDDTRRSRFPANSRFGPVAWYRVFLPELLPQTARVLYLDVDTIVLRSLDALWNIDLQGRAVGAVANPLYPFMDTTFMQALGVKSPAEYFNSGVLLIDLEYWRRENITDQLLHFAAAYGATQEWPDQNALNAVLLGHWLPLSPEWNAQNTVFDLPVRHLPFDSPLVQEARNHPAVVHFIGPYKPWHYRCKHRYRQLYWRHLKATPWANLKQEGVNLRNFFLRLLPEQFGWKVETGLQHLSQRIAQR